MSLTANQIKVMATMAQNHVSEPEIEIPETYKKILEQPLKRDYPILEFDGNPSGGPRTEAGKAKSALNSRKHGFYSSKLRFESEEELAEFESYAAMWLHEYSPRSLAEEELVGEIAAAKWKLGKANELNDTYQDTDPDPNPDKYLRVIATCQRAVKAAIKEFQDLRAGKMEVKPPIVREYQVDNTPNPGPKSRIGEGELIGHDPYDDQAPPIRPGQYVPNPTGYSYPEELPTPPSRIPLERMPSQHALTPEDAKHFARHGCVH